MGIQSLAASFSSNLEKVTPYAKEAIPLIRETISKIGLRQLLQINLVYQLFDSGLANFLALDTIRQGTALPNYIVIQLEGGSFYNVTTKKDPSSFLNVKHQTKIIESSIKETLDLVPNAKTLSVRLAFAITGVFQPVIKFRFTPTALQEKKDFENNPYETNYEYDPYRTDSYRSDDKIGISHLGISGSLIQGINLSLFGRIYNKPGKFALGCAQLIAAIALTCIYCGIVTGVPLVDKSLNAISAFKNTHYIVAKIAYCALHITTW